VTLLLVALAMVGWVRVEHAGIAGALAVAIFAIVYHGVMAVIALFALVMGGIYTGAFTTTEAAGIGAALSVLLATVRRALTWSSFLRILDDAVGTTSMLFMIVLGAIMFGNFVNYTTMPGELRDFVLRFSLHPIQVVIAICVIYILLGAAMEELSMILITMPLFFPIVVHLGFDPVWFGILVVVVVEIGTISPPVGMILFLMRSLHPDIPMASIYRGVVPFFVAIMLQLAVLIAFPQISLLLPKLLFK
jgi:tripartite ATP-independent transporter DctM subunit